MSKYSIILPVRNGGHYVKECVNSILSQTYTGFNFIIFDNCSTDGTREWLQSVQDNRIKVIPSDKSLTIEENWGRVKDTEKNEFITLIGHDDILYPDFLKHIDKLIDNYPEAGLYHTHFHFIDARGKQIRTSKLMPSFLSFIDLLKAFLTQSVDAMGTGYVMRAKDYDAVGGIPVRYPNLLFADFELWLQMASKGGMAVSAESSFAFRIHQSTTSSSQDSKLHEALNIYVDFLVQLENKNSESTETIKKYGSDLLMANCRGFAHRLLRTPISKRNGLTVNSFIEETKKMAIRLNIQTSYFPENIYSVKLAKIIDQNIFLSRLFLLFKKVYSKPVL